VNGNIGELGITSTQSTGLLGSNDLESGNDLHMADGESNSDVAAFAQSWLVGGRTCSVSAVAPTPTQTRVDECDALFRRRQSPLRTCFGRVAPRAYHTLCTQTLDKCNATVAYVRACKEQTGLELMVPEDCREFYCRDWNDTRLNLTYNNFNSSVVP
jgi:hypothetical protein